MNKTFDNKRIIKPLRLEDIDRAFYSWWNDKLNLNLTTDDGTKRKVPVQFVSPERWSLAREEGIRTDDGNIILPIIAITRTRVGGPNEGYLGRVIADTKKQFTYAKRINPKSSLIKELVKNRKWTVDPSLPIYEVFSSRVADQLALTYEVSIWTQYTEQMNEIIEKVGQEYDYLSVKSFSFETDDNFYFVAFQDDELADEGNIDDYTDDERMIKKNFVFSVPGYIIPEPNDRKSKFRRYLSQTKLVFKQEVAMTQQEYEDLIE